MMDSLHFWLRLLICFLGLWGCGWTASVAARRRKEKGPITPLVTIGLKLKEKLVIMLTNTAKIGLGVALGTLLGMGIRDRQLVNNRWTWTDIEVQKKFADRDFQIQPARMDTQHVQICSSSTVDWYEGERLDYWTFEQRKGCKRVITYHEHEKGETNVSLQMR